MNAGYMIRWSASDPHFNGGVPIHGNHFPAEVDEVPGTNLFRQATTARGQDQSLTRKRHLTMAWRPFQWMRSRLRKSRRAERLRELPIILHWPDPQRAARAAAPLIRWERNAGTSA
jgi:hypothetical protein